jgi:hypothetical protein
MLDIVFISSLILSIIPISLSCTVCQLCNMPESTIGGNDLNDEVLRVSRRSSQLLIWRCRTTTYLISTISKPWVPLCLSLRISEHSYRDWCRRHHEVESCRILHHRRKHTALQKTCFCGHSSEIRIVSPWCDSQDAGKDQGLQRGQGREDQGGNCKMSTLNWRFRDGDGARPSKRKSDQNLHRKLAVQRNLGRVSPWKSVYRLSTR